MTTPTYRHTDALAALDAAQSSLADVRRILMEAGQPEPDLGYVVEAGGSIQDAIDAAQPGGIITVRGGRYDPFVIRHGLDGLTVQAYPGERPLVDALVNPSLDWSEEAPGVFTARYKGFPGRRWHWSRNDRVELFHRQSAIPDQFVYQHEDRYEALRPVFELKAVRPGTFFVDGNLPNNPERVYIMLPEGAADPRRVLASWSPHLCTLEDGGEAQGVALRGLYWGFCGSTHKTGSVHLHTHWTLEGGGVAHGAGCGVVLHGTRPAIIGARIEENGHCSFYSSSCTEPLIEAVHTARNGTRGANAQYERGGKLTNTYGAEIRGLRSEDEARPLWLDISCNAPVVDGVECLRPIGAGVQFEHWMQGARVSNVRVVDVQPYDPGDGRVRRFGVQIQSGIVDGVFNDFAIDGADIGVVYKKHEPRAASRRNTFARFTYANCERNSRVETMGEAEIRAAIARGAKPDDPALWQQPDIFDASF